MNTQHFDLGISCEDGSRSIWIFLCFVRYIDALSDYGQLLSLLKLQPRGKLIAIKFKLDKYCLSYLLLIGIKDTKLDIEKYTGDAKN